HAPSAASASATAAPMPLDPPVTIANFPRSRFTPRRYSELPDHVVVVSDDRAHHLLHRRSRRGDRSHTDGPQPDLEVGVRALGHPRLAVVLTSAGQRR